MAQVITVINQKGGVGKSTQAVHVAVAAAEKGFKVLLADFDTQGNASQFLTGDMAIRKRAGGSEQLFGKKKLVYTNTEFKNIDLLHGHSYLESLDKKGDRLLAQAVEMADTIRSLPFDYIIFDTPPSFGVRHISPLFWSDIAIIPVEPNIQSIGGMDETFQTIESVRGVNPNLQVRLTINKFNRNSAHQNKLRDALKERFGDLVIAELSSRSAVAEAQDSCTPVWHFAKDSKLRREWKQFALNVLDL